MKTLILFLISYIITSPLHAMDNAVQSQDSWLRCPEQTRTMVHEIIKGNEEEIIKRDLISIPEYHASASRGAYSAQLLNLYKTHNPTSKHYEHAKKWVLADAVMYSLINTSNAHKILTDHPITFGKDNPSDKELLWNVAAVAIMRNNEQLKQQANTLMTENQIPLPDNNFMTYLLSYAIIMRSDLALLNTCVTMGAKLEGIKKDSPFTPWIIGDQKERERDGHERIRPLGDVDYSSPVDCAIRENKEALIWLKEKDSKLFNDQVWMHYLIKYAEPVKVTEKHYYALKERRSSSILAILTINPDLKIDHETADMIYNNCNSGFDAWMVREEMYPITSWGYHLSSNLKSFMGIPHEPITHTTSATARGDDAV